MTRIFNRLDESVSSKQAEGLRKAEDGFREIRVIRALKKREYLRSCFLTTFFVLSQLTIVIAVQLLKSGLLTKLGVAPSLGVSHIEGYTLQVTGYRPLLTGECTLALDAHGEEAKVSQADGLTIQHQLLHTIQHVGEDTMDYPSGIRRIVLTHVTD